MQVSKTSNPVLGIMSGTSLDGVDLALCLFTESGNKISYSFLQTETVPLPPFWLDIFSNPFQLSAEELAKLHVEFGKFLGETAKTFLKKNQAKAGIISSHGQTMFHNPASGYTFQLGHGAAIAHTAGIDTVCDFRTGDVVLGGQGAPLVPIGDELLFGNFDGCLNLGGFSNISCRIPGKGRIGFDISPVNYVLNDLANKLHHAFDDGGQIAASGNLITVLFDELNALPYYTQKAPKSLGAEWVKEHISPLMDETKYSIPDLLRTFTEHVAHQIAITAKELDIETLLSTGGGTKNTFLIERIQSLTGNAITIPDHKTLDFKEALIFALLGYLRVHEKANVLASVTGADINSCSGAIYKAYPQVGY